MNRNCFIQIKLKNSDCFIWVGVFSECQTNFVETSFLCSEKIENAKSFPDYNLLDIENIEINYWINVDEAKYYLISDDLITIFSIKRNPHLLKLKKEKFYIYKTTKIKKTDSEFKLYEKLCTQLKSF